MIISQMELYKDNFIIIETEIESMERYQIKSFYYQTISGIIPFRYSMSRQKSYMFMNNRLDLSLTNWMRKGLSKDEIYRILAQISLIIDDGKNYLLYEENFYLNPNWIFINKEADEIRVELAYIPFKKDCNEDYKLYEEQFVRCISKFFNEINEMEGFYYFVRLMDDIKDEVSEFTIRQHIEMFLNEIGGRKENRNMIL